MGFKAMDRRVTLVQTFRCIPTASQDVINGSRKEWEEEGEAANGEGMEAREEGEGEGEAGRMEGEGSGREIVHA